MLQKRFHEKNSRSIIKSITFRIIVVSSDLIIIYALTHRLDIVLGITIATNLASIVLYYAHERVWNIIRWGKISR
jgi:uncharacterized membrane protein